MLTIPRLMKYAALILILSLSAAVAFGGFPLSIQLPSSEAAARLEHSFMQRPDNLRLSYQFQFSRPVRYRMSYNNASRTLVITFDDVTRHHFRRALELADSHLERISLSRSRSRQYRIEFSLRENVMPLPFASKGQEKDVEIRFLMTKNPEIEGEKIRESLSRYSTPLAAHLSRDYEKPIPLPALKPAGESFSFYRSQEVDNGVQAFRFQTKDQSATGYGFSIKREFLPSRLKIVSGSSSGIQIRKLSEFAEEARALASVNGSYFMTNGDPLGLLIADGRLVSTPILDRACFGVMKDGTPHVGHARFTGWLRTEGLLLSIEGYNQESRSDKTLLYSREFGVKTPYRQGTVQYVILNNRIVSVSMDSVEIPQKGYVLSISPKRLPLDRTVLKLQEEIELDMRLSSPWDQMQWAIGGGPRLLKEGEVNPDMEGENFSRPFLKEKAPRTGIGFDARGNVILMVVDGRQEHSQGLNLEEFAQAMKDAGAVEAINLDGGGSTSAWYDGMIVNHPSDGGERRIANALVILPTKS